MKISIFAAVFSLHLACLSVCSAADAVSRSSSVSFSAGGNSFNPVLSADGSRLVFFSHPNNLATNDNRREWLDVFTRDLVASNTVLVSVSAAGSGGGNGNSFAASISSNGQFIAFASEAGDLINGDTNGASDVFLRDVVTGTTRLVSIDVSGNAPLEGNTDSITPLSANPMVSTDGRWVFFESRATNLSSSPDTNKALDVFARDMQSNTTLLVTRSLISPQAANAGSELAAITPEAGRVAFISAATDLVAGVTNGRGDVYVRDMVSNVTYWVSTALSYPNGYRCVSAALSENGRYVAFVVVPTNEPAAIYRRDVASNITVLVGSNVLARATPQISADGRYVAFETGTNVFRWDATTGLAELVNVTRDGQPPTNGVARNVTMTVDGNGVFFASDSGNLTTNESVGVFQIYARDMAGGLTRLVTASADGRPAGTGHDVSLIAAARDFSRVAFDSISFELVAGDANRSSDVFVRDLSNATTQLVSERASSLPRMTGVGHAYVDPDSISANGRIIAFTSYDTDLIPGDTNGWPDVFIHDTQTGITVTPGFSTNFAKFPVVSATGRYVVYSRFAFNSAAGPFPFAAGITRFDRETGTNEAIPDPEPFFSNRFRGKPAISGDGNWIAFQFNGILYVRNMSRGTNLMIGAAESISISGAPAVDAMFSPNDRFVLYKSGQLYGYDLSNNRRHLVSGGFPGSGITEAGYGGSLSVSGNSRHVVFRSTSLGLIVHDLLSETNGFVHHGANASVSVEGRFVAYSTDFSDAALPTQIVVKDRQTGALELMTVSTTGAPARQQLGRKPIISGDGRFMVFGADASDLVGNDTNSHGDVFVRDRLLGTTILISRNLDGMAGNAASALSPVMAADGRSVVFHSMASDLVTGDYNDKRDIFVLKLGGADSDGDGMDDDWEVAYFGNLSRSGNDDFDSDGARDLAEFLSGTDPTNEDSIFRVLTVTPIGGGGTRVMWAGNPNRVYRVEYKDDLNAAGWTALNGTITWNGSTASVTDPATSNIPHRYYRVVRLP